MGGDDYDLTVKLAKDLDLFKSCVFTGVIKDAQTREAFYQIAKLFVFPSVCDNAPVTILEAASQKTPTLCIEKTFPAEVIKDGENGYLSPLDENKFAEKIVEILTSQNRIKVGERAYKELLNKDIYKTIFSLYKSLVK